MILKRNISLAKFHQHKSINILKNPLNKIHQMLTLKKRTTLLAAVFFALISFQSCTTYKSYWVAPEFTNVSKITQLRAGMSTEEINKTLGTQPYDVYHI